MKHGFSSLYNGKPPNDVCGSASGCWGKNRQDLGEDGGWQSRLGATAEGQQPGEAEAVGADLRGQI